MITPSALVRRIPLLRRPFWQRDNARAERDRLQAALDTAHGALPVLLEIALAHQHPRERKGRNVRAGNARGSQIEFGNLISNLRCLGDFKKALSASEGRSIVTEARLANLYILLKFALPKMDGDLVEFGAYRGGSALFMASLLKSTGQKKVLYACDTFEGMPETDSDIDMHVRGDFKDTSYEELEARARALGLSEHLVFVRGRFEDTLPTLCSDRKFALVHVDCDIYEAVKFVLATIDSRLEEGAYVVFDDPLTSTCLGALEAVEETYVQARGLLAEQAYPHLVFRPKGVGC